MTTESPQDFQIRPATMDDLEAVLKLMNTYYYDAPLLILTWTM